MGTSVNAVECVIVTALAVSFALGLLSRRLGRGREGLAIAVPFAVGFGLRLVVIAGVAATGIGASIRDAPDELHWLAAAHKIAASPWGSAEWLPWSHKSFLQAIVMALQMKVLGSPVGALRITMVGIALAGAIMIAAAVHDLAGPRAGKLAAWLLALAPASLLFNDMLLKEPLMELASGVLILGAARAWRRVDVGAVLLMGLGATIALGARFYIGWLLFACAVAVILHASLRQASGNVRTLPLIYAMVAVIGLSVPVVLKATSNRSLEENLQPLQSAESTSQSSTATSGGHLALAEVDFSSREAVAENLPTRIGDVLLHPYPWQVSDMSERLGAVGSVVALLVFLALIRFALACRGEVMARAGPVLYPLIFMLIGYALATGNAGQGFRYRTHLVTLAIAAMVILRAAARQRRGRTEDLTDDLVSARGFAGSSRALVASPSA